MEISSGQFAFLRLSNPSAAFGVLVKSFSAAIEKDYEMVSAFASFQKNFKAKVNTAEDARRIAALANQGADKLGINIGPLPLSMSAGLAFMYDAAVEGLRSSDTRIDPRLFTPRAIRTIERLLDIALPQIGSTSVIALELALADKGYADRLRHRASELDDIVKLQPLRPPGGICEFCSVIIEDQFGNVEVTCLSEEECHRLGGSIIVLLIILLVVKIIDWLF